MIVFLVGCFLLRTRINPMINIVLWSSLSLLCSLFLLMMILVLFNKPFCLKFTWGRNFISHIADHIIIITTFMLFLSLFTNLICWTRLIWIYLRFESHSFRLGLTLRQRTFASRWPRWCFDWVLRSLHTSYTLFIWTSGQNLFIWSLCK